MYVHVHIITTMSKRPSEIYIYTSLNIMTYVMMILVIRLIYSNSVWAHRFKREIIEIIGLSNKNLTFLKSNKIKTCIIP